MKLSRSYTMDFFGKYLASRAYSPITVKKYQRTVRDFFYWMQEEKDTYDLRDVTGADILAFQSYVTTEMNGGKKRYATSSIEGMNLHPEASVPIPLPFRIGPVKPFRPSADPGAWNDQREKLRR